MFRKARHLHFVGIGGAGMSGIAEVLLTLGYRVSGSDLLASEATRRLGRRGGKVFIGHNASHLGSADVVVVSSAVAPENIEVQEAKRRRIPVIPRAEMLAELMRLKCGIAVAGTHGKTTTTSLIGAVLHQAGLDPTTVIGGTVRGVGSGGRLGLGDFLVAEADESDGSFLRLSPMIAVVTTIDHEHLDYYGSFAQLQEAFCSFINKVPFYGLAILCLDQATIRALLPEVEKPYRTYGLTDGADLQASEIRLSPGESRFSVCRSGDPVGEFSIPLPGRHHVANALAAITVGLELEISVEAIRTALAEFSGVDRRFQQRGEKRGVMVVDDYGHHPTEVAVTLEAAKSGWNRRVLVVFQPHRYTRTRDLADTFATAFGLADLLILTEIYPAGESPIPGVTGEWLASRIATQRSVEFVGELERVVDVLLEHVQAGDMVLTLGAGDVWKVGVALLDKL